MKDREHDARVAALWILHGGSCAKLLRAHGRTSHADQFEAALHEVAEIVADQIGRDAMSAAMDWASNQLWGSPESAALTPVGKSQLH